MDSEGKKPQRPVYSRKGSKSLNIQKWRGEPHFYCKHDAPGSAMGLWVSDSYLTFVQLRSQLDTVLTACIMPPHWHPTKVQDPNVLPHLQMRSKAERGTGRHIEKPLDPSKPVWLQSSPLSSPLYSANLVLRVTRVVSAFCQGVSHLAQRHDAV